MLAMFPDWKENRPNLFIIGAPRCGTTSLSYWLSQHPQVYFSSIKEPFLLSPDVHQQGVSLEQYKRLFNDAKPWHKYRAEGSTSYLFSRVAVPAIEKEFPGSKYIVMIRSPIEMALSLYTLNRRIGEEDIADFEIAWRLSPMRRYGKRVHKFCRNPKQLDYQEICRLGTQLERLFAQVPRERILVLNLDDVKRNPKLEYLKVLDFLELPDDGRESFDVLNKGTYPRWPRVQPFVIFAARVMKGVARSLGLNIANTGLILRVTTSRQHRDKVKISKSFLEDLLNFYRPEVENLELLLDQDLSDWLNVERYKSWLKP